jgi:myo-inositol-1(or 4)-monophosphatase
MEPLSNYIEKFKMNIENALQAAIKASAKAGKILIDQYQRNDVLATSKESNRDVYTSTDQEAELVIIEILKEQDPNIPILCEERGLLKTQNSDYLWVVDALDGTVNYIHQIPFFSVSIALLKNNEPVVGAIYAPLFNDLYYAARGVGAFKNQARLLTRDTPPTESLFAASFSGKNYIPAERGDEFSVFGEINDHTRGCLRTGSASLNLAYLAEGKINGCWGKANKKWDISAGLLIASEAGATIKTRVSPVSEQFSSFIAAPQQNFQFLEKRLSKFFL